MSVGSVSGSPDLYNLLHQVSGTAAPSTSTVSSTATPTDPASSADPTDSTQQTQPHHHHHHGGGGGGGGGGGELQAKIQTAVTAALQNAGPNDDPNKIVENAIAGVLKPNNPADPSTSSTAAPTSTPADPAADKQQFDQLLQSFGVDPKSFHADFRAAVSDARESNANSADPATLFGSFPPGTNVDTTA